LGSDRVEEKININYGEVIFSSKTVGYVHIMLLTGMFYTKLFLTKALLLVLKLQMFQQRKIKKSFNAA
jgi:hypothetical protein